MNTEEFIQIMKDLIRCYDQMAPGSLIHREIMMWREKFLESQPKFEDIHKSNYVNNVFLSTPSYGVLNTNLNDLIDDIAESYSKDNK